MMRGRFSLGQEQVQQPVLVAFDPGEEVLLLPGEELWPPEPAPGVMQAWYNPVDWAKSGWKQTKRGGKWVWKKGKWVVRKGFDPCTYLLPATLPAQYLPGLKTIVRKNGCSRTGKRLGSLALATYATTQGGPAAGILAQVGSSVFYGCLCSKWEKELPPDMRPEEDEGLLAGVSTPLVVGGLLALGAGAYLLAARAGATATPAAAPPAPAPATPATA